MMFKSLIYAFLFLSPLAVKGESSDCRDVDCAKVAPFKPAGVLPVTVKASHNYWKNGELVWEEICNLSRSVQWFDIRGREKDAYCCLKPQEREVFQCETALAGVSARLDVVAASWIRNTERGALRDYHFHGYIVKKTDPSFYLDIFSRFLTRELDIRLTTIEGAIANGPANPNDGYWVRAEFN